MTLDEIIQRENKIAEENQKIVDTEIVFDDVSLSQLYCDDTEVIEEHLENYKKCAEYHKKVAELLEELKVYQQQHIVLCEKHCVNTVEDLYVKAIDDFADKAQKECDIQNWSKNYGISFENLEKISKQLKAGVNNE